MRPNRLPVHAQLLGLAATLALSTAVQAQDATGGPAGRFSFGLKETLSVSTNPALSPSGSATETLSTTRLSFGFLNESPADRLEFSVSGVLRVGGALPASRMEFSDRRFGFGYDRSAASGAFSLSANLREDDVRYVRSLEDFINADGFLELPDDFTGLSGTGTRRATGISASLRIGDQSRLGATLRAGVNGLTYVGTSAPELVNNERRTLGADLRFSLNDVTSASLGLDLQDYTSATTTGSRQTRSLSFRLDRELANGKVGLSFGLSEKPGSAQSSNLSLNRSFDTKTQSLGFALGASTTTGGATSMTGSLRFGQELPNGSLSLQASRGITTATDDTFRLNTTLSAGYSYAISPSAKLALNAAWSENRQPDGTAPASSSSLGVTYSQELGQDWALNAGINLQGRASGTGGNATGSTVFLGLGRSWP